jgi:hypothetical protein
MAAWSRDGDDRILAIKKPLTGKASGLRIQPMTTQKRLSFPSTRRSGRFHTRPTMQPDSLDRIPWSIHGTATGP